MCRFSCTATDVHQNIKSQMQNYCSHKEWAKTFFLIHSGQRTTSVGYSPIEPEYVTSLLMPARCRLVWSLQTMESAESIITQFMLHLQIHEKPPSATRSISPQSARYSYILIHAGIILVNDAQIQFLFSVNFGAHVYFQPSIQRLKISSISYPYRCLFAPSAQKGMGREKLS